MGDMEHLQKPIDMLFSSRHSVDNLYQIAAEVTKLYISITTLFSSFFIILQNALTELRSSKLLYETNVSRFDIPTAPATRMEKSVIQPKVAIEPQPITPSPIFTLNLSMAKSMISSLAAKPLQPSKPAPSGSTQLFAQQVAPKLGGASFDQESTGTLISRIAELQASFDSAISPTLKMMSLAMSEYQQKAAKTASTAVFPTHNATATLSGLAYPLISPTAKDQTQISKNAISVASKFHPSEMPSNQLSNGFKLTPTVSSAIGFAAGLPLLALAVQLSQGKSAQPGTLAVHTAAEPYSSKKPVPSAKPTSPPPQATTPALTSWFTEQNETLRNRGINLASIPTVNNRAEAIC